MKQPEQVFDKPSFGSRTSEEGCSASSAYRTRVRDLQERQNREAETRQEAKQGEKVIKGGLGAVLSVADALTR